MADRELNEDEVMQFLHKYRDVYEAGDPSFFDFFSEDTTIFTDSSPTRIDGLEEFRRGFEPLLTAGAKRRGQILSPEVKIVGPVAYVSFHNRVSVDGIVTVLRATLVFQKDKSGLKITHMHNSPINRAPDTTSIASLESVTLLEERVATAAATVGTPK